MKSAGGGAAEARGPLRPAIPDDISGLRVEMYSKTKVENAFVWDRVSLYDLAQSCTTTSDKQSNLASDMLAAQEPVTIASGQRYEGTSYTYYVDLHWLKSGSQGKQKLKCQVFQFGKSPLRRFVKATTHGK